MIRRIGIFALALASLVTLPGCPEFWRVLPKVVQVVTDAILVLDQAEEFSRAYFAANPNPDLEKKVAKGIAKCRSALGAAQRAASGTEKLGQEQVDAAFADFRAAWVELSGLLAGIPGLQVQRDGAPMLSAAPGGVVLPEPEALRFEVEP
jgi:hypothetical protein